MINQNSSALLDNDQFVFMKSPSPITKGMSHSNNTRNIPKIFKPVAGKGQSKTAGAVEKAMKKSHS